MSQEMNRIAGNSYNYLSTAPGRPKAVGLRSYVGQRLATAAGYSTPSTPSTPSPSNSLAESEERQGWRAWAGEKARRWRGGPSGADSPPDSVEHIRLFPGWAARRYSKEEAIDGSPRPFEVEISTSGYAVSFKNRESMSRSQRAFIRVAKGFAALPKLVSEAALVTPEQPAPLSKSTEELLNHIHLPPRPDQVGDPTKVEEVDRQFIRPRTPASDAASLSSFSSSAEDLASALKEAERRTEEMTSQPATPLPTLSPETLRRMHANMETRLEPFWSSVLANRTIRLTLYATPHQDASTPATNEALKPLYSKEVTTGSDGSFHERFIVPWEDLCQHPSGLHIAFGEPVLEHDLEVHAELLKPQLIAGTTSYAQFQSPRRMQQNLDEATHRAQVKISITHSPIRVISDIDDTVKQAGVPSGARAVFYNVFAKDLNESIVEGMSDWYNGMWDRGVRFHYVSNGPFEFITILDEFFALSKLPVGSVKLRSFAGRSLFSGLFSAPAERKRAGVEDIVKSFPDSRFFLIGDSGEQDLELYAQIAKAYPDNVLGVYIRDVTTRKGFTDPLEDPTGETALIVKAEVDAQVAGWSTTSLAGSNSSQTTSRRGALSAAVRRPSASFSSVLSSRRDSVASQNGPQDTLFMSEPESLPASTDEAQTPTATDRPTFDSLATVVAGLNMGASPQSGTLNASNGGSDKSVINQAPKPIQPPSIHHRPSASFGLTSPSTTRAQRRGTGGSSASDSDSNMDLDERVASRMSSVGSISSTASGSDIGLLVSRLAQPTAGLSPEERKRTELQMRVWKARLGMPPHVKLRVFQEPSECLQETDEILQREAAC